jgi:hypothetical protein
LPIFKEQKRGVKMFFREKLDECKNFDNRKKTTFLDPKSWTKKTLKKPAQKFSTLKKLKKFLNVTKILGPQNCKKFHI